MSFNRMARVVASYKRLGCPPESAQYSLRIKFSFHHDYPKYGDFFFWARPLTVEYV